MEYSCAATAQQNLHVLSDNADAITCRMYLAGAVTHLDEVVLSETYSPRPAFFR
jgi:hypothetical protein